MSLKIYPGITLLKFTPENLRRHQSVGHEGLVTIRDKPLEYFQLYFVCGMRVYICLSSQPIEFTRLTLNDARVEGFRSEGEFKKEIRRIYGPVKTVHQSLLTRVRGISQQEIEAMEKTFRHEVETNGF